MRIRAGRFLAPGDEIHAPMVVIHGGKITGLSAGGVPQAGAPLRDWGPESVLTPGLVDLYTHLGIEGGADEAHTAVTADLRVSLGGAELRRRGPVLAERPGRKKRRHSEYRR